MLAIGDEYHDTTRTCSELERFDANYCQLRRYTTFTALPELEAYFDGPVLCPTFAVSVLVLVSVTASTWVEAHAAVLLPEKEKAGAASVQFGGREASENVNARRAALSTHSRSITRGPISAPRAWSAESPILGIRTRSAAGQRRQRRRRRRSARLQRCVRQNALPFHFRTRACQW